MWWKIPSPHGDFLVVMWRTLVGILTGPLTLRRLSLAPRTRSAQTMAILKRKRIRMCDKKNGEKELKSRKWCTLFEILDVLRGEGDPDLMDLFLSVLQTGFSGLYWSVSHCVRMIPLRTKQRIQSECRRKENALERNHDAYLSECFRISSASSEFNFRFFRVFHALINWAGSFTGPLLNQQKIAAHLLQSVC